VEWFEAIGGAGASVRSCDANDEAVVLLGAGAGLLVGGLGFLLSFGAAVERSALVAAAAAKSAWFSAVAC
jgi:hypothetical protein